MASRDRVAQAKSRAERSRPPTVPVPQIEIVPGRLSEGDWLSLLSFEEAEDSVGDILAGMLDQVMEECYKVYLARQCIPYVINQAREALLQIIEWRFLVRDEGEAEVPTDPAWQEDEEPVPCITDSWAQGSVPVLQTTSGPRESELPLARLPEEAPAVEEGPGGGVVPGLALGPLCSLLQEEEEERCQPSLAEVHPARSPSGRVRLRSREELPPVKGPPTPPSSSIKLWPSHQAYDWHLRAARFSCPLVALEGSEKELLLQKLSQVSTVGEEEKDVDVGRPLFLPPSCSNLLRIQPGRPPVTKGVFYDERGRVTLVPRLDPARLPKHWIRPTVEVVDPDAESRRQEALKTVSGRCTRRRQRPRRHHLAKGREAARRSTVVWEGPVGALWERLSEQADHPQPPPGRALEPTTLIFVKPTLLMETVELAPGVTLRCGGCTSQRLPLGAPQQEEAGMAQGELRPLCPQVPFPPAAMEQRGVAPRPLPRLHPGAAAQSGCRC